MTELVLKAALKRIALQTKWGEIALQRFFLVIGAFPGTLEAIHLMRLPGHPSSDTGEAPPGLEGLTMSMHRRWVRCPVCSKPYLPNSPPVIEDFACRECNEKAKTADSVWLADFKSKRCSPEMAVACKSPD